jgi:hypothetical protein
MTSQLSWYSYSVFVIGFDHHPRHGVPVRENTIDRQDGSHTRSRTVGHGNVTRIHDFEEQEDPWQENKRKVS